RGLRVAERKLAVAPRPAPEEEHMPGAVHRLHRPRPPLDVELEHQVLVLRDVARDDEGLLVVDDRRLDLEVATLRVLAPADLLELLPDGHPLRVPERRSRRVLREVEQVEPRAEPPVVAALRLLQALEMRVERLLGVEGGAVDPG